MRAAAHRATAMQNLVSQMTHRLLTANLPIPRHPQPSGYLDVTRSPLPTGTTVPIAG
jgi:hypothetical protein